MDRLYNSLFQKLELYLEEQDADKSLLYDAERAILAKQDAEAIYTFASMFEKHLGARAQDYTNALINAGDVHYIYLFAKDVKWAITEPLLKYIIESGSAEYNYKAAIVFRNADKKAHAEVVIESKDPHYNFLFANYVTGADVRAHGRAVIESGDVRQNCKFADQVKGADVRAHLALVENSPRAELWKMEINRMKAIVAKLDMQERNKEEINKILKELENEAE